MKVISRKEALALRLSRYFTGKPCKHGHYAERYTGSSMECVACHWPRAQKASARRSKLRRDKLAEELKVLAELCGRKIVTRRQAKTRRLKLYFTGRPCPRSHVCERYTRSKQCVQCAPELRKASYERHREERIASARAWALKNPEKRAVARRKWATNNPVTEEDREKARKAYPKYYNIGPQNPTGEAQWLRKCKVLLRTANRISKKKARGVPLTSIEESAIAGMLST